MTNINNPVENIGKEKRQPELVNTWKPRYKFESECSEKSERPVSKTHGYYNKINSDRTLKFGSRKLEGKDLNENTLAKAHHFDVDRGEINEGNDLKRRFVRLKHGSKRHNPDYRRKRGDASGEIDQLTIDGEESINGEDRNRRAAEKEENVKHLNNGNDKKRSIEKDERVDNVYFKEEGHS